MMTRTSYIPCPNSSLNGDAMFVCMSVGYNAFECGSSRVPMLSLFRQQYSIFLISLYFSIETVYEFVF